MATLISTSSLRDEIVLDNVITETDFYIKDRLRVNGDIRAESVYIDKHSSVVIIGSLIANRLYVTDSSKLHIQGQLTSAICASNNTEIQIGGRTEINNEMQIMDNVRLTMNDDLVVKDVDQVEIGNNTTVVIGGEAVFNTHMPINDLLINIHDNTKVHVKGNLKGFNRLPWGNTLIGNNSQLLIDGNMSIGTRLGLLMNSSLVVKDRLCLSGCVTLEENSSIIVTNDMILNLSVGDMKLHNNCIIKVGKGLETSGCGCIRLGSGNTLDITKNLDIDSESILGTNSNVYASCIITHKRVNIQTGSNIKANSLVINDFFLTESNVSIITDTIFIAYGTCILGENTRLVTSTLRTTDSQTYLSIGSNSLVQIQGLLKTLGDLRLGMNVRLEAIEMSCVYILASNNCKLQTVTVTNENTSLYLCDDCQLVVTKDIKGANLHLGYKTVCEINGDAFMSKSLLMHSLSRLTIKGNAYCKYIDMRKRSEIRVSGNVRTGSIYAKMSSMVFISHLLVNVKMYLDANTILIVNKCLFSKDIAITNRPNDTGLITDITNLASQMNSELATRVMDEIKSLSGDSRVKVIIGQEMYLSNKLYAHDKELLIIGNLHINKRSKLTKTEVNVNGSILSTNSSSIDAKIRDLFGSIVTS